MRVRSIVCAALSLSISFAMAAQQAPEPLRVPLDETGIADWRFLNPLNAEELTDRDLEFVNTTGDRTFVVSIPYESEVLGSAFLSSRVERGPRRSLETVVCHVLGDAACTPQVRKQLQSLETMKGFQEVVRRAALTKSGDCPSTVFFEGPDTCDTQNPRGCGTACSEPCISLQSAGRNVPAVGMFDLTCQLEKLFWKAACRLSPATIESVGTRGSVPGDLQESLNVEVAAFVASLFDYPDKKPKPSRCSGECAWCARTQFHTPKDPRENLDGVIGIVEDQARATAVQEFEKRHLETARAALLKATDAKAKQITEDLAPLDELFENRRKQLDPRIDFSGSENDRIAQCLMRELESAARLLTSHSHNSVLPFDLPLDVAQGEWCFDPERVGVMEDREYTIRRMENQQEPIATQTAVDLLDCKVNGTKRTCAATAVIPPNQRATFTRELLSHHPDDVIRFRVVYYGDPEVPPNGAGAVARVAGAVPKETGRSAFGFGIDTTSAYDLPSDFQGHRRHTGASGALSFQYLGETRLDFSTTLRFKQGDFGGPDASNQLSATQYQARISFANRTSFQAGRIRFAQPSAGIAVSESGEGIRGAFSWGGSSLQGPARTRFGSGSVSAAYIIRRESDASDFVANEEDDDSDVYLLQYNPVIPRVRNFLVTALLGQERNDRIVTGVPANNVRTDTIPRPYTYATIGADARFGVPRLPSAVLNVAAYHSVRNVRPHAGVMPLRGDCEEPFDAGDPCIKEIFGTPSIDGRGTVALLTFTMNGTTARKITDPPAKSASAYAVTGWFGAGTGNDPDSAERDEGYLGETAGYANDVIFLNQISKNRFYTEKVGRGLSNKYYLGAQYSDSRISPLEWFARLFKLKVESRSTAVSLHTYRFNKPVNEGKYAGSELDLEFKTEVPKGVNWIMKTAFYQPGRAVERLATTPLLDNPWSVTFGVSVTMEAR